MQRNGGGRDPFSDFGDPFAGLGGFGGFGGPPRSLMANIFGGRDPFDDPFFSRPFGGMLEPSLFGPGGSSFPSMHHPSGFIEHRVPEPNNSRGPIIEELNSDGENEEAGKELNGNPKRHRRSTSAPYVEDPDDAAQERRNRHLQQRNEYSRSYDGQQQPQMRSFSFQSSVTYGGANGAYYTSSQTRRTGSDGITFEERKEADTASRQATHQISRGIQNKGHSLTRKLNSDGRVDSMQTLHNLNEDELPSFEESWNGNARRHLPGWSEIFGGQDTIGAGSSGQTGQAGRGGWALPSTERFEQSRSAIPDIRETARPSPIQQPARMKGASDVRGKTAYPQGKARK